MKKFLLKSLFLLCALIVGSGSAWADTYTLATSLSVGDEVVLVNTGVTKELSGVTTSGTTYGTAGDVSNSTPTGLYLLTVMAGNKNNSFSFKTTASTYLSWSSGNSLTTASSITDASSWNVSINAQGVATITNAGTTDRKLQFNGSNPRFACYTSSQTAVKLYKRIATHSLTYSATNGTINGVDANSTAVASGASIAEGATVTLTATPSSGYAFDSWSITGTGATLSSTSTNPTTFTMGTANATVTANFVASSTPSIGLSSTSIDVTTAETEGTITVTYNNIANVDAEVKFYESDGTTPADYNWLDAEINATDNTKLDYAIGENTGAARTAYMKVHEKNEDVYSGLITVTQEAIVVDAPTISPAAGAVAAGSTVTLTHASADQIRYTTDGTAPTKTTGTVYSEPISITTATTIKAIAIKNDVASDVAEAAYTITVESPTFSIATGGGSYLEGTSITLTSASNTIYYTIKTGGTAPSDPTNSSTPYTDPIALSSGTNIIKAVAYDTYGNKSSVVSRTYKGVSPTTLPFSWAGGTTDDFLDLTGVVGYSLGDYTNTSHNPYNIKMDADDDYIEIFTNGQPGKVTIGVKMIGGGTTSKIKVQESTNGIEFTDVETLTISGSSNSTHTLATTQLFATTTRVVKLLFDKGSNVGVGPISIAIPEPAQPTTSGEETYLTTSDNMAGWRAFYDASNSYSVDANTKVYVADTDPVGTTITLKAIEGIPTAVPVILHTSSSADNYKMTLTKETSTPYTYTGTNLLTWTASAVSNKYRLGYGASGVGFYPYSGTPASGAVILDVSSSVGAHELTIDFGENEVTAINEAKSQQPTANGQYYDLQGRKVANPSKGLYIVNGHKVIVK